MAHWLLKTEPSTYSFADLQSDKKTTWDGVRNNLALKHIRAMAKGDLAFVYHSGAEKAIVGVAEIVSNSYADPKDGALAVFDLKAVEPLKNPVTLASVKADKRFAQFELVRMPRLSVMPVPSALWNTLRSMAK